MQNGTLEAPETARTLELDDDLRELIAQLADYTTGALSDVAAAKGSEDIETWMRQLETARALWLTAETGVLTDEHLPAITAVVRSEHDWCVEEIKDQGDDLQRFIVREERGASYSDDRADSLRIYREQLGQRRRDRDRCAEFLRRYG